MKGENLCTFSLVSFVKSSYLLEVKYMYIYILNSFEKVSVLPIRIQGVKSDVSSVGLFKKLCIYCLANIFIPFLCQNDCENSMGSAARFIHICCSYSSTTTMQCHVGQYKRDTV